MIIATLLVMLVTVYILFDYQRNDRESLARAQGLDLARLLGGMPWSGLIPEAGRQGLLEVLQRSQGNPDFAYGAVVDVELSTTEKKMEEIFDGRNSNNSNFEVDVNDRK
jgi:hypothetical protein